MTFEQEFQKIEIAIELDKGKSFEDVAKQFGVRVSFIKTVAQEAGLQPISPSKQTKKRKNRRSQEEQDAMLSEIQSGKDLIEVAEAFDVKYSYLSQLCKRNHISPPRAYHQLKPTEKKEIRELLEDTPVGEIIRAYNISLTAIEKLQEPVYLQLSPSTLGVLLKLLREDPMASDSVILKQAKELGYTIDFESIQSYRQRLQSLKLLKPF